MDPRHAVLFEPLAIGPKTLPNRFYQVPHASGFGSGRPRHHAAFRGVKAEGGWGGVCTDFAPVSSDSEETWPIAADCWDPADMRRLGLVADAIHEHGALAGIELYHGGGSPLNGESRRPRLVPTQAASIHKFGATPSEMTKADIARVQQDFRQAALRARDVGFDIIYVYGAHGYLMSQMLSPVTNRRTDEYGGSLTNRMRFQREVLEMLKDDIGADCALAVRTLVGGGELVAVETEEILEFVHEVSPLVDLFDVNVGGWAEDSGTSRYFGEGHHLAVTSRVREATDKPIVTVGRFTNPDLMASLITGGRFDLIGAARPAIADPYLPTKIREGRLDEIRECTGSNQCILREESFAQVACVQNPTAGEEYRRGWHPESVPQVADPAPPVLVVGAGPAGLECAITLGRRGFDAVHLVEAEPELGGRLRWIRRLPGLGDWGRIVDHRLLALERLPNVEVITGRRLEAADVLDYGAELVVVATGSTWRTDGGQPVAFPIVEQPLIGGAELALTPEAVMAGQRPDADRVVVYDTDGYFVAASIAELLATEGRSVDLVTPATQVARVADAALEGGFLRRHLHRQGIRFHTGVTLTGVEATAVHGLTEFAEPWTLQSDDGVGVVLVTQQLSRRELYDELVAQPDALTEAGISGVHLVGDAVAPRLLIDSIFDGHRLAREIESEVPMVALPWLRERGGD